MHGIQAAQDLINVQFHFGNLYKYRTFSDENHKRLISHNELFFASPASMADKDDCRFRGAFDPANVASWDEFFERYLREVEHLKGNELRRRKSLMLFELKADPDVARKYADTTQSRIYEDFGVLSLARTRCNSQVWQAYAAGKTGFCVGLDTNRLQKFFLLYRESKQFALGGDRVRYFDSFPSIDAIAESLPHVNPWLQSLFMKKTEFDWEDEFRFVISGASNHPVQIPDNVVSEVYVGEYASIDSLDWVKVQLRSKTSMPDLYHGNIQISY